MSFRGLIETKTFDSWSVKSLRKSSACPSRGYWAAIIAWFSQKVCNKQKVQSTKDKRNTFQNAQQKKKEDTILQQTKDTVHKRQRKDVRNKMT